MSRYLIDQNIALLQQGLEVLSDLPDFLYGGAMPEYFSGTVGKHVRHILNFYESFIAGIGSGRIDYDARARDPFVESALCTATTRIQAMIRNLQMLPSCVSSRRVLVHQNEGAAQDSDKLWEESTLGRELQALVSHTVHHFAIIALMLRIFGVECPKDFGVAPSTLEYERSLECAPSPG